MKEPEQQLEELARGGIDNKQEKRERTIRVRQWTYDELRKIGVMGMDFDDVITKLIVEYKKRHG
jgi:predicted CopG family antitoxin